MAGAAATPATAPPAAAGETPEFTNWKSAERLNTLAAYQAYLAQYPDGAYAAMAKAAMATLRGPATQVAAVRPQGQTPQPARAGGPRLAAKAPATDGAAGGGQMRPFDHYMAGRKAMESGDRATAARSFFLALRGWPKQNWAPDAAASLALVLAEDKRPADACRTLEELPRRYPDRTAGVAQRMEHARQTAGGCGS